MYEEEQEFVSKMLVESTANVKRQKTGKENGKAKPKVTEEVKDDAEEVDEAKVVEVSEEDVKLIAEATVSLTEAVTAMDEGLVATDAFVDYFAVVFLNKARGKKQEATDGIEFATLVTDSKKGSEPANKNNHENECNEKGKSEISQLTFDYSGSTVSCSLCRYAVWNRAYILQTYVSSRTNLRLQYKIRERFEKDSPLHPTL